MPAHQRLSASRCTISSAFAADGRSADGKHPNQPLRARDLRGGPAWRRSWRPEGRWEGTERGAAQQPAYVGRRQDRPARCARHRLQGRGHAGDDRGRAGCSTEFLVRNSWSALDGARMWLPAAKQSTRLPKDENVRVHVSNAGASELAGTDHDRAGEDVGDPGRVCARNGKASRSHCRRFRLARSP